MQFVQIWLLDAEGNRITGGGHRDPWVKSRGTTSFIIGQESKRLPPDTASLAGESQISVSREKGKIQVLWNGEPVLGGHQSELLSRVEVVFGYYAYPGSTFGTESIRKLEFKGNAIQD